MKARFPELPFDLFRCADCGLVQQFPRASVAKVSSRYDRDYYVFHEDDTRRFARAVQQYLIHLRPLESGGPKRLLDLGCARGHFSALAKHRGWRVTGIDLSGEAVSHAVATFGIDARAGMLARHASTLPPFDVVFLGDVIEHVPDPRDLLKDVYRVLAPRGSVCIDTPNWGGFWRRIGRSRWLGINPFHINLFDATALTHLLERCGFRRIETHAYTHYQYASLNSRPEFARLLSWLPRFMRSRIRSILTAAAGAGDWADLRDHSPATLEQASDFIHRAARDLPALRMSRWGDNLMATALRA